MKLFLFSLLAMLWLESNAQREFSLPLHSLKLTSTFGGRIHPITGKLDFHRGLDLSARCEPVLSVLQGYISATGFDQVLGNFVKIDHGDIQSIYGHLRMVYAIQGEWVSAGSFIGITGSTGRSTGEHLHFAVKYCGNSLDPLQFLLGLYDQIH